jgi:hypothetical protein
MGDMAFYDDSLTVDISVDKERVKQMSTDEKLNVLVDIAFANHRQIRHQGEILYGGKDKPEGICEVVRTTKKAVIWLWGIFCGVSGVYFTLLVYHIMK